MIDVKRQDMLDECLTLFDGIALEDGDSHMALAAAHGARVLQMLSEDPDLRSARAMSIVLANQLVALTAKLNEVIASV